MRTSAIFTFGNLCSQSIELLCRRVCLVLRSEHLPLANRVHDFYPRDRTPRRPKGLEPQHRTCESLPRSMVLLHEVIYIFRVTDDNGGLVRLVEVLDRHRVAATLVNGDLLGQSLGTNGFAQEGLGCVPITSRRQ